MESIGCMLPCKKLLGPRSLELILAYGWDWIHNRAVRFPLKISLSLFLCVALNPASADKKPEEETVRAFIYSPKPDYPYEARALHVEGNGVYKVLVNLETGLVTDVIVKKTTGYRVLDDAAVIALRKWRLKPHAFKAFSVPIDFSVGGYVADELSAARAHATFAPAPVVPFSTRMHGVRGHGRFQLWIDPGTGRVREVKILESTSDVRLDDAALKAFRQWRFVPHTVSSVTVPITL